MSVPPAGHGERAAAADAEPASAGLPMSRLVHGAGSVVRARSGSGADLKIRECRRRTASSRRGCVTASPTYAAAVMLIVAVPAVVQDVPFAER